MKNKNNIIKILVAGIMLVFLLCLIILLSFIKLFSPKVEKVIEKSILSENYSLVDISSISFDLKKSNFVFKITDGEELSIVQDSEEEKFYLDHKIKNKTLSIVEDAYIINPQKKNYIVYVPQNYLNKIVISNGFGNIEITGVKNNIEINNNSGNIIANDTGDMQIKDVSGNLEFNNIAGKLSISTSIGNINVKNIIGSIKAETITGDIFVENFGINADTVIETVSGDIDIKMIDNSICKIYYYDETGKVKIDNNICKDEINLLNVKSITGNIKIF